MNVPLGMRDASAFDDAALVGLARRSKRDPYRLGLFARHLEPEERALVLLAVHGGTLVVTDRRVLEFRAHLEVHGAWNVKEFQGYEVRRQFERAAVQDVTHRVVPAAEGTRAIEDAVDFALADRTETVLVSRGPEATLSPEDYDLLRDAVLGQPK